MVFSPLLKRVFLSILRKKKRITFGNTCAYFGEARQGCLRFENTKGRRK